MKFDEALKLQNFKEHYSIILGNVDRANIELESVLEKRNDAENQILALQDTVLKLEDELNKLTLTREQVVRDTDARIKKASEIESTSLKFKEETDSYISGLDKIKNNLQKEILSLQEELDDTVAQKEIVSKSISILSTQVASLSDAAKTLTTQIRGSNVEKDSILKEKERYSIEHKKNVEKKTKELESIEKKIAESETRVLAADRHFAQKELDIARRENDVLIITKRLRALFQEVKPGIALKI